MDNFDISKIIEIAEGDLEYQRELLLLSLQFFKDFKVNFRANLSQFNWEKLRYMIHKGKPSLALFKSKEILDLLNHTSQLINQHKFQSKNVEEIALKMDDLCDYFIQNIEKVI